MQIYFILIGLSAKKIKGGMSFQWLHCMYIYSMWETYVITSKDEHHLSQNIINSMIDHTI